MKVDGLVNGESLGLAADNRSSPEEWVVQKFGGTSVGKFPLSVVNGVIRSDFLQASWKSMETYTSIIADPVF